MIPSGLHTQGMAQLGEITGTLQGLYRVGSSKLVRIQPPVGGVIYLDLALIPGGEAWVRERVGHTIHLRTIARELGAEKRT